MDNINYTKRLQECCLEAFLHDLDKITPAQFKADVHLYACNLKAWEVGDDEIVEAYHNQVQCAINFLKACVDDGANLTDTDLAYCYNMAHRSAERAYKLLTAPNLDK